MSLRRARSAVIGIVLCVPEATVMPRLFVLPLRLAPLSVRTIPVPEPGAMPIGLTPVLELKFKLLIVKLLSSVVARFEGE